MREFMSGFRDLFAAKIGRCAMCMRRSLAAALAMWGLFGIGLLMWPDTFVQDLIGVLSIGLSALWLLHVGTYTARGVMTAGSRNAPQQVRETSSNGSLPAEPGVGHVDGHVDRRHTFQVLLRAAGVGVVASIPLLWPSIALAFCGQCTRNDQCGVGWVCKNTAPVNSGKVCNECVKS